MLSSSTVRHSRQVAIIFKDQTYLFRLQLLHFILFLFSISIEEDICCNNIRFQDIALERFLGGAAGQQQSASMVFIVAGEIESESIIWAEVGRIEKVS